MPENNGQGLLDLLKDPRYTLAAFAVVIMTAFLLFVKESPDWVRVAIPVLLAYAMGSGLIAWCHTEFAFLISEKHPAGTDGKRPLEYHDGKAKAVKVAGALHFVWTAVGISVLIYVSSKTYHP